MAVTVNADDANMAGSVFHNVNLLTFALLMQQVGARHAVPVSSSAAESSGTPWRAPTDPMPVSSSAAESSGTPWRAPTDPIPNPKMNNGGRL